MAIHINNRNFRKESSVKNNITFSSYVAPLAKGDIKAPKLLLKEMVDLNVLSQQQ